MSFCLRWEILFDPVPVALARLVPPGHQQEGYFSRHVKAQLFLCFERKTHTSTLWREYLERNLSMRPDRWRGSFSPAATSGPTPEVNVRSMNTANRCVHLQRANYQGGKVWVSTRIWFIVSAKRASTHQCVLSCETTLPLWAIVWVRDDNGLGLCPPLGPLVSQQHCPCEQLSWSETTIVWVCVLCYVHFCSNNTSFILPSPGNPSLTVFIEVLSWF